MILNPLSVRQTLASLLSQPIQLSSNERADEINCTRYYVIK